MAKNITLEYDGKEYILEFTRQSVITLEHEGFDLQSINDSISNNNVIEELEKLPLLFWGSFLAHQPDITKKETDDILDNLDNKGELWNKLFELYVVPFDTLFGDSSKKGKDDNSGKAKWGANW